MIKRVTRGQELSRLTLMVSGSSYYRQRADVQRGMKKRDMPSCDILPVSQAAEERAADPKEEPKPL